MEFIGPIKSEKLRKIRSNGTRRNATYRRYNKPPYSYLGMVAVAIESAPGRRLTLGAVHAALKEMFPFFTGVYTGWKDSVRHNLTHNSCFYKVTRESKSKMHPKGNYWMVDLTKVPDDAFKRQASKHINSVSWAKTLQEQLHLAPVNLDSQPSVDYISNLRPGLDLTSSSKLSTEGIEKSSLKTGVKNFKIETILKTEVKVEESDLNADKMDSSRYCLQQQNKHVSRFLFPGPVLPANPHLLSLLKDTASQSHGYQNSAVENLRRLCPPANYGTPPNLHRTWTTQPTSPRQPYQSFPPQVHSRVKDDSYPEPMDLTPARRYKSSGSCFTLPTNKPTDQRHRDTCMYFPHENPERYPQPNTVEFQNSASNVSKHCSGYYQQHNHAVATVTSEEMCNYVSSQCPAGAQNHQTLPSPMSVFSHEHSRSPFQSPSCLSQLSSDRTTSAASCSFGEPSPMSPYVSLQDIEDSATQLSNDAYFCQYANRMFLNSSENNSGSERTYALPEALNTQNLNLLASWAVNVNENILM